MEMQALCTQEKEESANTGYQFKGQEFLLVPSEEPTRPEVVTLEEGLIAAPTGQFMPLPIQVANTNGVTVNRCEFLDQLQKFKTTSAVKTEQVNTGEKEKTESKQNNTETTGGEIQAKKDKKTEKPSQWDPQSSRSKRRYDKVGWVFVVRKRKSW